MANNTDPLPESEVKQIVDTWVNVSKIPSVSGGHILEDDNFLNVITKWSVDDAAKKEGVTFSRTFSILKSSLKTGGNPIVSNPGLVIVNEKFAVVSKSGQKRAVLVEKAGNGGDASTKTEFLQVWNNSTLLKSYNLGELDLHKSVYTSAGWGITMAWSDNETKLAYLAEKKVPKAKSFYSSAAAKSTKESDVATESSEKKKEAEAIGEEYAFKQTWGEQLTEQYYSVIVTVDVNTDEFNILSLPDENFPTDIQWIGDSHICGTFYPIPVWRLGLIFCSNRESVIFSIQADGENFQALTEPHHKAARSARVRPDGNYLVWQERILDGAHGRARAIYGAALNNGQLSGQPRLLYDTNPENGLPIYQDFFRNCWSTDGKTLYAVTPNEAQMICLAITIEEGTPVQTKKLKNVHSLLAITKDYLLVGSSTMVTTPQLGLLDISQDYKPIPIVESSNAVDFKTQRQFVYGEFSPPAIYHGPAIESVPPNSIPLIVCPHGGPHASSVDRFCNETVFFLKLGFAILEVNYVGSTGGTKDTTGELLGKVGDRDVKDCQAIVEKVLNSNPCLNPDKVVLFGGSHGGFLGCHLSAQYPDMYKAAVLINPVTDLATMVGTTDITDWVYAEAGVAFPEYPLQTLIPTARNLADAEKYIKASPIHLTEKVKAPSLLLLGSEDLRVPAQQGINYYRALKAHSKIAEVRMYPDCHSLFKPPVHLDVIIHSALWFKRYLR